LGRKITRGALPGWKREERNCLEWKKDGRGIVRGVLNDGRRIVLNSKQAFRK